MPDAPVPPLQPAPVAPPSPPGFPAPQPFPPQAYEPKPRRVLVPWLVAAGCALAAVVMAALWLLVPRAESGPQPDDASAAGSAAADFAEAFMTFDPATFDAQAQRVQAMSTGQFASEYAAGLDALRRTVQDNRSTSSCRIAETGVSDPDVAYQGGKAVEFLLFVDVTVTGKAITGEQLQKYRVKLLMAYVDGGWKAARLDLS